ncbi:MAG: AraC family transcriptional regulator [Ekhidna sp.]|nr:AraC family transcriptional regulator [Ekhidna sp.]
MTTGNLLDILILFGSIQGFITAGLLFSRKHNQASQLLAFILLIISLACLNIYFLHVLPSETSALLGIIERTVPLIIIMPLGPLIYFHTKAYLGHEFSFKEEKLHFLSTILDILPSFVFIICTVLYLFGLISSFEPIEIRQINTAYEKYVDIPRWLSTSIYLLLAYRVVTGQKQETTRWLKQFLGVFLLFQVIWLLHLIPYILPPTSNWLLYYLGWYPIYVPLTLLVYWLGTRGIIHLRNTRSSTLDKDEMRLSINILTEAIESEKLFLDSTLSLNSMIEKTGLQQKEISGALNQYLGKSFNEWINGYRVEEVKRKLADRKYDHLSITGIGLESGFNSQATFQRAFKAATQMTPKAYRNSSDRK